MTRFAASCVALPLVRANGQFTPPWLTRPVAVQLSVDPESVPVPEPVTLMLPPQVPEKVTFAVDVLSGITVYFTLPHPVAGVDGVTDDHVPANTSMLTDGDGAVGDSEPSPFLSRFNRSHPAVSSEARTNAVAK